MQRVVKVFEEDSETLTGKDIIVRGIVGRIAGTLEGYILLERADGMKGAGPKREWIIFPGELSEAVFLGEETGGYFFGNAHLVNGEVWWTANDGTWALEKVHIKNDKATLINMDTNFMRTPHFYDVMFRTDKLCGKCHSDTINLPFIHPKHGIEMGVCKKCALSTPLCKFCGEPAFISERGVCLDCIKKMKLANCKYCGELFPVEVGVTPLALRMGRKLDIEYGFLCDDCKPNFSPCQDCGSLVNNNESNPVVDGGVICASCRRNAEKWKQCAVCGSFDRADRCSDFGDNRFVCSHCTPLNGVCDNCHVIARISGLREVDSGDFLCGRCARDSLKRIKAREATSEELDSTVETLLRFEHKPISRYIMFNEEDYGLENIVKEVGNVGLVKLYLYGLKDRPEADFAVDKILHQVLKDKGILGTDTGGNGYFPLLLETPVGKVNGFINSNSGIGISRRFRDNHSKWIVEFIRSVVKILDSQCQ